MLKQPVSVVKLTNVAVIRYKLSNKSFQIACYRNKAINWRGGQEDDLSEVLQLEQIYQNASHGTLAKKTDLNKFFPGKTKKEIIEIILEKGQLQVSDKERNAQSNFLANDIATIVQEKCVHPVTLRQFHIDTIKQAIKSLHLPIRNQIPAKAQALHCIKALTSKFKITRAKMRVKLTASRPEDLLSLFKKLDIQHDEKLVQAQLIKDIDPSHFRVLIDQIKTIEEGRVDVLLNAVVNKQAAGLEEGMTAVLQIREDWKQEVQPAVQQRKEDYSQKKSRFFCKVCKANFEENKEFREHYKSEWHKRNAQLDSQGKACLSEQEYLASQLDLKFKF